ncbi:hypothetical protein E2F46_11405 [Luteimonas aestuarii]|uniref:Uncharacterized protein n=1 Tax=Luteimonas aestuarii TaxID=453837 RepID=A0A4R5TLJ4_9GAMM|nr:hypothetical protein [Luteimonas aestuarii]TDK23218.1 hypothetical protein E2F46_11405 [Luteimonas aestuarii]
MNAFAHFPATVHWNAQQLADAVPPRLSQLLAFDRERDLGRVAVANRDVRKPRRAAGYFHAPMLHAPFNVR